VLIAAFVWKRAKAGQSTAAQPRQMLMTGDVEDKSRPKTADRTISSSLNTSGPDIALSIRQVPFNSTPDHLSGDLQPTNNRCHRNYVYSTEWGNSQVTRARGFTNGN
jgi:hypothetical protein